MKYSLFLCSYFFINVTLTSESSKAAPLIKFTPSKCKISPGTKICFSVSCELLPLLEAGASWEVSAFASQIYLPSSSGSPCPVFFIFLIFQHQFSNVFYIHCSIVISINFNPTALTFITSF